MTGPVKNCQLLYCVGIGLFICARPLADGNQNLLSTQKRGGVSTQKEGEGGNQNLESVLRRQV